MSKTPQKVAKESWAYTIEDKYFGKLKVKKSANAWWMRQTKVENLITGFKMDCKVKECLVLAGITQRQYEYFKELHPEFCGVLEDLKNVSIINARMSVMVGIQKDPYLAFKYLERRVPDEFKERKDSEIEKPILIADMFDDR